MVALTNYYLNSHLQMHLTGHICQGVPGTKHQISGGTVYLIKGLDKLLQLALQDGKISSKLGEHGEYR